MNATLLDRFAVTQLERRAVIPSCEVDFALLGEPPVLLAVDGDRDRGVETNGFGRGGRRRRPVDRGERAGQLTHVQEGQGHDKGDDEAARDRDSPPAAPGRVGALELAQLLADPLERGRPPEIA